ncbi:hypothetical protein FACS1894204_07380 [Synergistales bacterium]|nr:hypothetical protein FACS1894204_07380 [Synergistales bacterium]
MERETFSEIPGEVARKGSQLLGGGVYSGLGRTLDLASYLADKVGFTRSRDAWGAGAKQFGDWSEEINKNARTAFGTGGENPSFWDNVFSSAGSSIVPMTLSALTTGVLYLAPAVQTFQDAGGEAGNVLNELLRKGATEEQASSAANKNFFSNLIIDAAQNYMTGPFSGLSKRIGGVVVYFHRRFAERASDIQRRQSAGAGTGANTGKRNTSPNARSAARDTTPNTCCG